MYRAPERTAQVLVASQGHMDMAGDGKTLMAMPKTPLPAGTYKVRWSTVGADAKKLQGEFSFTAQ